MEFIWNSRHDSGIGVFDEQHHELFQMVARLHGLVQEGAARSLVEALLEDLLACSARHFAAEEAFMSKFAYPDYEQHVSEHQSMLGSLQDLKASFLESRLSMVGVVPTFLEGWLKHHISNGDFGFISFLKARNLS